MSKHPDIYRISLNEVIVIFTNVEISCCFSFNNLVISPFINIIKYLHFLNQHTCILFIFKMLILFDMGL